MNRLFSILMAAFLCCSLQNLSAEGAEHGAEGLIVADKEPTPEEIKRVINQLGIVLAKKIEDRGSLGACQAGDVAQTVAKSAAECIGSQLPGGSALFSSDTCGSVLTGFTDNCCGDGVSGCVAILQTVLQDLPNDISAAVKQLPKVGSILGALIDHGAG